MKFGIYSIFLFLLFFEINKTLCQPVICPAPISGSPECYQTSRTPPAVPTNNPLWQWPPLPHQDCCNAIPLCNSVSEVSNGTLIPTGAPLGTPFYPGCVRDELPNDANTCFSGNEKGTTWYKFKIRPLPNGPTSNGAPAGKLRFRIIPQDAFDDPTYDPGAYDPGSGNIGNTDYDFLLFDVTNSPVQGGQCGLIKNSTSFGTAGSVIKSCNWTGTRGPTGLYEPGIGSQSAVGPATRFNKPLSVKVGQIFVLAIDNFGISELGFTVDFRANESITDDSTAVVVPPRTDSIKISKMIANVCPSKTVTITFESELLCDSVTPSKFKIVGANAPYVISSIVAENGCNSLGVDSSFVISFQPDVPDSTLKILVISKLTDICGNSVIKDSINFRVNSCSVSVENLKTKPGNFNLIPNPNNGRFRIVSTLESLKNSKVYISDLNRKTILVKSLYDQDEQFDLSHLPAGIYFIQISGPDRSEYLRWNKE